MGAPRRPPAFVRERLEREAILAAQLRRAGITELPTPKQRAAELERRFTELLERAGRPADRPPF